VSKQVSKYSLNIGFFWEWGLEDIFLFFYPFNPIPCKVRTMDFRHKTRLYSWPGFIW